MTDRDDADAGRSIRRVREGKVFGNHFVTVYDDDVIFPRGRTGRHLRIVESEGRPGVAVLATCRGRYALVRVYRYPLGAWEWGIPRGFAHGDDPLVSARAELHEELGAEPATIRPMGVVTPNSGLLAARVHLYYAEYDEPATAADDVDEVATIRWVDLPMLLSEIAGDVVVDAFTLSAITAAGARGVFDTD